MMAGNIAVFGGNGLTGSEVVYQALERGDKVTAFCRDPSKLTASEVVVLSLAVLGAFYCIMSSSSPKLLLLFGVVVGFPRDLRHQRGRLFW